MWRGDAVEEQLSNELEAHWDEWRLTGAGEEGGESTVWIAPDSTLHPDLAAWCEKYGFVIKEYGVPEIGEGPDAGTEH